MVEVHFLAAWWSDMRGSVVGTANKLLFCPPWARRREARAPADLSRRGTSTILYEVFRQERWQHRKSTVGPT